MKSSVISFILTATILVAGFAHSHERESLSPQDISKLQSLINTDVLYVKKEVDRLLKLNSITNEQKVDLLIIKATSEIYSGEYNLAQKLLAEAESNAENRAQKISIYQNLNSVYLTTHNYTEALAVAKKQLEIIYSVPDISIQVNVYIQLMNLFHNLSALDYVKYYGERLKEISNGKYVFQECLVDFFLAARLKELNEVQKAKSALNSIINKCEGQQTLVLHGLSYRIMGQMNIDTGQFALGLDDLAKAKSIYKKLNYSLEMHTVKVNEALAYKGLNQLDKSYEYAMSVVEQPDGVSLYGAKQTAHQVLGEIAYQKKAYQKAYHHSQKEQFYRNWLFDDAKAKRLAVESAKFNFEELERDLMFAESRGYMISGLELKHRRKIETLEADERYRDTVIVILLGLLIGSWAVGIALVLHNLRDKVTGLAKTADGSIRGWKTYQHSDKTKEGFGVAIIELDNIMQLKDHYGEYVGNQILKDVATLLKNCVGKGRAYRDDFNRFYVYFLCDNQKQVAQSLEEIFTNIGNIHGSFKQLPFQVRASIGYDILERGLDKNAFYDATSHASAALDEAKKLGGNKLIPYSEDIDNQNIECNRQMRFVQFIDPKLMGPAGKLIP
ncbi:diguanylate cyclase [Parashewanella curva]|uniref:Diguanylate cyclase n=1 Tax=Parashewanella curva TaxID=2338552 RepID=A0A3L8PZI1_9GAMM|nr:diguanylate cyclase [Parashewanella curva]RLV59938.1 diguanylate cyclase [Parashewanella curva]